MQGHLLLTATNCSFGPPQIDVGICSKAMDGWVNGQHQQRAICGGKGKSHKGMGEYSKKGNSQLTSGLTMEGTQNRPLNAPFHDPNCLEKLTLVRALCKQLGSARTGSWPSWSEHIW